MTGEEIYRVSPLAREAVPVNEAAPNGKVMGQDTVMAAPYRGRLFWIFGDTNKPSYPKAAECTGPAAAFTTTSLGHFRPAVEIAAEVI